MPKLINYIETELGIERQCTVCKDYFPADKEFFYSHGKLASGKTRLTPECKPCWEAKYRKKDENGRRVYGWDYRLKNPKPTEYKETA